MGTAQIIMCATGYRLRRLAREHGKNAGNPRWPWTETSTYLLGLSLIASIATYALLLTAFVQYGLHLYDATESTPSAPEQTTLRAGMQIYIVIGTLLIIWTTARIARDCYHTVYPPARETAAAKQD